MRYVDQNVLITGASSGIGEGFAREFHARGANVVLVARRAEQLAKLCEEFNRRRPRSAQFIAADIAGPGIGQVIEYARGARIDILVSNAGRGSFGCFESLPVEEEVREVELNALAPLRLMHALIPRMKERRSGAIISVSSMANFQPLPYMATYAATKAFNFSHALGLRYELAPFGVRVVTICPGPVETEFSGVARVPGRATGMKRDSVEDVVRQSFTALERNRAYVVPCLKAKLAWLAVACLPRALSTYITAKILKSTLDALCTPLSSRGGGADEGPPSLHSGGGGPSLRSG